jgi:hypothetical protein
MSGFESVVDRVFLLSGDGTVLALGVRSWCHDRFLGEDWLRLARLPSRPMATKEDELDNGGVG